MQLVESIRLAGSRVGACALIAGCLFSALTQTFAAPPANDTCAGAVVIPSTTFPYFTPVLTNMHEATLAGDSEPPPDCIKGAVRGVWYRFTPNQDALYTFSTGVETATTAFDTILAVYAASGCGTVTNVVACNDDSGAPNNRAGLAVSLRAGTDYFVLVWLSAADNDTGPLSVQIRVDRPALAANDTCATAEVIPGNSGLPQRSAITETLRAAAEGAAPSCGDGYRSVWYRFTPPTNGTYILATGNETATTVFDTIMVLYSTATDCNGLVELACSDNGEGRGSLLRTMTGGTTYYIAIHDQSIDPIISETTVQLNIATPTVPTVTTLPFINVGSTGAVLTAIVNPNGKQTRWWFEWGPTTAYTSTSQTGLLLPATTPTTITRGISGILPNVTYHYRIAATNELGRSQGSDMTFAWQNTRPMLLNPEKIVVSGTFRFSFTGNSKQVYNIESSTNLTNWSVLGQAGETPSGSGQFQYSLPGVGTTPRRFFRANAP